MEGDTACSAGGKLVSLGNSFPHFSFKSGPSLGSLETTDNHFTIGTCGHIHFVELCLSIVGLGSPVAKHDSMGLGWALGGVLRSPHIAHATLHM